MRLLTLTAAVLAISACGKNNQADTTQNADQGMTAESIAANDVTAIDAVTGDAANMAADVDMNYGNLDVGDASSNSGRSTKPSAKSAGARPSASESNSAAPATTNATGNSE